MNLLIISADPGRVGIFATVDARALAEEIGRSVSIDTHYALPCAADAAHDLERHVREALAARAIDADRIWFGATLTEAIEATARVLARLGLDSPVVTGMIHPKKRACGQHEATFRSRGAGWSAA